MGVHEAAAKARDKAREVFFRNRYNYAKAFEGPAGEHVLKDIAKFCHMNQDLFREDARHEAYILGQQRVILRIFSILKMTDEQIFNLTQGPSEYE
jgi:hypothetical protein